MISFQQWEEAITFLERQAPAVQENDAVKSSLAELREANDREGQVLQAAGSAYAALHRADLAETNQKTEAVRNMQGPSELGARLAATLEARVTQVADHVVANALSEARSALQEHDPKRAVDILASSKVVKDFLAAEIKHEWQDLKKRAGRARLLGRFGIRIRVSGALSK